MLRIVERITPPKTASRFLSKSAPVFGKYWIVPEVLKGMASESWQRWGTDLKFC